MGCGYNSRFGVDTRHAYSLGFSSDDARKHGFDFPRIERNASTSLWSGIPENAGPIDLPVVEERPSFWQLGD